MSKIEISASKLKVKKFNGVRTSVYG